MFNKKLQFGTGAVVAPVDHRDRVFDGIAFGAAPFDWERGYDIRNEIGDFPIKNQDGSSSCVGQGWSYYIGILNAIETGTYQQVSAKSIYSLIALNGGGAYIRDGGKLAVNRGSNFESDVPSYDCGNPPSEIFMTDKSWQTDSIDEKAKILQAQEYRTIQARDNMETFAIAIRDNYGVVGGVAGSNNGTWNSLEPKPPKNESDIAWHHCLYYGVAGVDSAGKFIATPNSWGTRGGWQKLRQDYFTTAFQFDPWTLTDKPNATGVSSEILKFLANNEKKLIIEGEAPGRKGIIINNELREITRQPDEKRIAVAEASLYIMANNGFGITISKELFDKLPKGNNF